MQMSVTQGKYIDKLSVNRILKRICNIWFQQNTCINFIVFRCLGQYFRIRRTLSCRIIFLWHYDMTSVNKDYFNLHNNFCLRRSNNREI